MKNILVLISCIFTLSFFFGCQTTSSYSRVEKSELVISNHMAGSQLIKIAKKSLKKDKTIITASFVNIDNLTRSSSFGRIASQQVATQLTNAGFHVVEMLLGKDVIIQEQKGEFLLSRKLQRIGTEYNAQAVLVGTYAVGNNYVYVTTKIIDALNSKTISSYDYKIPKDYDIKELLEKEKPKAEKRT